MMRVFNDLLPLQQCVFYAVPVGPQLDLSPKLTTIKIWAVDQPDYFHLSFDSNDDDA